MNAIRICYSRLRAVGVSVCQVQCPPFPRGPTGPVPNPGGQGSADVSAQSLPPALLPHLLPRSSAREPKPPPNTCLPCVSLPMHSESTPHRGVPSLARFTDPFSSPFVHHTVTAFQCCLKIFHFLVFFHRIVTPSSSCKDSKWLLS